MKLKDKVALITGADSGIGRATAVLFAREGANVAISYLCEHEDAETTKKACEDEGARAIAIPGDLGVKSFCGEVVQKVVDTFGGLDILVNNAGEQHPDKDITDITEEQLKRTFQTNIFSMFFVVQAARPHLKKGAAIVNCTSVTMYAGEPELLDYSSTKGAITAFTRSLSENLVKDGVRARTISPVIRAGATVGQFLPPQVWRAVSKPLISQLHRGGDAARPKLTPEQRHVLLQPHLEDIALLEEITGESFEQWKSYREGGSFHSRRTAVTQGASD